MTPEERASKAMAECVAKNKGKNMAFYLAQAIREAVAERDQYWIEAAESCANFSSNTRDATVFLSFANIIRNTPNE